MVDPLISVAALRGILDDVTVLDVRYRMGGPPGERDHAAGHVPGASYVDLDRDLAAAPGAGGGRHPLPDVATFEAAMRRSGVRNGRPVVVYDDWQGRAAARCWWLLRWTGHADVRVLDGGWSAWLAAGGAREEGRRGAMPGDFTAVAGAMPVLAVDDVPAFARDRVLVDARAPERYRGEVEPLDPVAGHIPGAVNVPTDANLRVDGTFRPADELRAAYADVGSEVAVYCGSGVTACHDLLALERLGITGILYPGSWSEWVSDASRPVAAGDG